MPTFKVFLTTYLGWLPSWGQAALLFGAIVVTGIALQGAVVRLLDSRAKTWHPFLENVFRRTRRITRFVIILFAVAVALPLVPLSKTVDDGAHRIFLALFIIQLGWAAIVAANIAMDRYVFGLRLDASDNLLARKAVTQMTIMRRAVNIMLGTLTIGFALMSFDSVRQFGISLFASAGLAGIVAGLAARPLFENLIAGVQLALTQPLRLEDAVVINNEWGWVEEITSTYIVVRLWDLRRQIVPLSYLFQNPFTNWTRSSSSIIGTVFLYTDYTLPVPAVRAKAEEYAKASALWDGKVVNVQVSDAKERTMEIRILVSASDSSKAWDLRCEVREKLISFIRDSYPGSLPRSRWDGIDQPGGGPEISTSH
jgi:small-conductance mechanosensitive channel